MTSRRILFCALALLLFLSAPAHAELQAALKDDKPLQAGREAELNILLTDSSGAAVTPAMLQKVHTQKIHLLVVDETLTDYHHLHPAAHGALGLYTASFRPQASGNYTVWIDVTPVEGEQQYIPLQLKGARPCSGPCVNKKLSVISDAGVLKATLSFDSTPHQGLDAMGMLHVTDGEGHPVPMLEPVMGAFAHIVGFYEDLSGVVHTHPLGDEPQTAFDRGGPDLMFHLEPEKAGYIKLYVQLRYAGQDVFLPFGVNVAE